MDNESELKELEAELALLRPREVEAELLHRIETSLQPASLTAARPRSGFVPEWVSWPAAACFVCLVAWMCGGAKFYSAPTVGKATAPTSVYKPVGAENILYDVREEGVTTLADGTAARRVRDRYVDVITWRNPVTQSSVRMSVPRDEIRLVPVQAY